MTMAGTNAVNNAKIVFASKSTRKVFVNKRFYLHFKSFSDFCQAAELIKAFGGQTEEFLDKTISYVLTDIPTEQWPPKDNSDDSILGSARKIGVKLMSYYHLILWCKKYISSQSSSDEDDETRVQTQELRAPFIKFEDSQCKFAPAGKELAEWPELNLNGPLVNGQTIFGFNPASSNTNTQQNRSPKIELLSNLNRINRQQSQQVSSSNVGLNQQAKPPSQPARRKFRRNAIYCELCSIRVTDKLEEHLETTQHKSNIENARWSEVELVIDSLPNLDSIITPKRVQLTNLDDHQEFLCLHKVESISQMFLNSSK